MTLKDKSMEVQLYHLLDNPREGTNLFAYVPRERMLVQADLYDAAWQQHPWGENVLTNLDAAEAEGRPRRAGPRRDRAVRSDGEDDQGETDDRGHELTVAEEETMVKKSLFIAVLACACAANAAAQDAKATIGAVSKALGADALKTVQYSATGFDFALGQAPNASAPWPKFIEKSYTRGIDFEAPASRVDRVRVQGENPPRGGGQQPIVGEQPQNQTIIVSANTPWVQQLEIWMMPHGFLRAAAASNATVETQTSAARSTTVVTLRRRQQGQGQRLHQRAEPGRACRDVDRQPVPRRHAVRGHLQRLQGRRRRAVPDAHRAEAGRAIRSSTCTSTDVKINAPVNITAAAGARRRAGRGGARHPPPAPVGEAR